MATATAQIHLKTPPKTKSLLQMAAELSGATNLTDYILRAAVERAQSDLAEHRTFSLSDEGWLLFQKRLDAPTREVPDLRALLTSSDAFEFAAEA